LTRSELIADLADANRHMNQADIELLVEAVFGQIAAALARGQRVELRGFGAFSVKRREARTGRNPKTGEEVPVKAKTVLAFRVGRGLAARLNRVAAPRPRRQV
jgi:integration host factor subunit beta